MIFIIQCNRNNALREIKEVRKLNGIECKLRGKRVEKGYNQEYMADLLNIQRETYSIKENNNTFRQNEIDIILKLFNCKYEDLF